MSKRSRLLGIGFLAALATLLGHALTYTLRAVSLADDRHSYFLPTVHTLVTLCAVLAFALVLRSLLSAPRRNPHDATAFGPIRSAAGRVHVPLFQASLSGFLALWTMFAAIQCTLFVAIESLEGYHAGLAGCLIQCLVALIAALAFSFFAALLERCEQRSLALGMYVRRRTALPWVWRGRPLVFVRAIGLNEERGIRRFQRPPPEFVA
ncbi:MAG: hypothetical protein M3Z14_01850 [Candidatus Eremiobacteraeota bacterium]|nr:hypothetical protein [Candidatus Eremiobacteraeota bacterium]